MTAATVTRNPTPTQVRDAYVATRRAEATAARRPIRRTTQPGLHAGGRVGVLLFLDAGRLMALDLTTPAEVPAHGTLRTVSVDDYTRPVPPQRRAFRVDAHLLGDLVRSAYDCDVAAGCANDRPDTTFGAPVLAGPGPSVVPDSPCISVIADAATFKVVRRMAAKAAKAPAATPETKAVDRTLNFRASLEHSAFLPVLTEALALAYWAPTDADTDVLDAWADAFDASGASPVETVAYLLCAVMAGPMQPKYAKSMVNAEKWGAKSAEYASVSSQTKAFKRSNEASTCFAAIQHCDPLLVDYNVCTGEVSRMDVIDYEKDMFRASVTAPFRAKVDSRLLMFDPGSEVGSNLEAKMIEASFTKGDERLTVTVKRGNSRTRGWWIVEMAKTHGRPLFAVEAPYLSFGSGSEIAGRWGETPADLPALHRNAVPVDVALAGAPTQT